MSYGNSDLEGAINLGPIDIMMVGAYRDRFVHTIKIYSERVNHNSDTGRAANVALSAYAQAFGGVQLSSEWKIEVDWQIDIDYIIDKSRAANIITSAVNAFFMFSPDRFSYEYLNALYTVGYSVANTLGLLDEGIYFDLFKRSFERIYGSRRGGVKVDNTEKSNRLMLRY